MSYTLVAIATAVLVIAATLLIYFAPNIFGGTSAGSSRQQKQADEARKFMTQVIGIIVVIVTLGWSLLKDSKNLELTINQSALEQYTSAIVLLKDDNAEVQAGGLYALGKLATAHPDFSNQVYRTVSAFANSPRRPPKSESTEAPKLAGGAMDAALYVLGARKPVVGNCPDLERRHAESLQFADAYFVGSDFRGLRGFRCADLQGALLYGAKMEEADLSNVRFDGARMGDFDAYGPGWDDDIALKKDWRQWRRYRFIVNLKKANLTGATFKDTAVSGAIFDEADLTNTTFQSVNLSRASFVNAKNLNKDKFVDCCADFPPDFGILPKEKQPTLNKCRLP